MTVLAEAKPRVTSHTVRPEAVEGLPAGWLTVLLSDVIQQVSTTDPARKPEVEITYFDISSIHNESGVVVDPKVVRGVDAPSRARQLVEVGDVLFSTVRPNLRAIAQVPRAVNGVASTGFCVLRAADSVVAKYLFYFVRSEGFLDVVLPLERGVSYPAVRSVDVVSQSIPLAPAAEQTRIVEKLEELLSDLDAGVAELKAAQKKLTQYRQSLLKAAVEGVLTADWRKHNHPAESGAQLLERILKERRARWQAKQLAKFKEQGKAPPKDWQDKYPEPKKPDTTDLPPLPEGWVWASIDQMAQVGTGVTPLRSKPAYFENGSIAWVTSGALNAETVTTATEYVSELALKECRLELYPVGALLVAMYGEGKTRGKCSELLIPATINQAIAALVLESQAAACKAYLKTFLLHSYEAMRGQASGGVQPNLNLQIIKTIALPLPPVVEQQEIASQIEQQFEQLERQKDAVKHALKQSTAQRKNILKAAFSGQLVPQDPNDEPASVLLARIRAERAGLASKPRVGRRKVALADVI